jgi:hypothetical protein
MKDNLTIAGLIVNMIGCGMLYLDSARVSSSISVAGPRLGYENDEEKAKFKDRLILWWGRLSIIVIGIGFGLQVAAFHFEN